MFQDPELPRESGVLIKNRRLKETPDPLCTFLDPQVVILDPHVFQGSMSQLKVFGDLLF